jgi:hypothetical protein
MAESTGSVEFLLGIEEYLKYLNFDRMAQSVHSLSRAITLEEPREETVKAFLKDFGGSVDRVELSDLMHNVVKSETIDDLRLSLLHYLAGNVVKNKILTDYIFSTLKSKNIDELQFNTLKFLGNIIDDVDIKDLIFGMMKSSSNDVSMLKVLLKYASKFSSVAYDQNKKDLIFSLTKASTNEEIYKSLLQYIGKFDQIGKNEKDLIFGVVKSSGHFTVLRNLCIYIGKSDITQDEKDFLFAVVKSPTKGFTLVFLLQFLGKILDNNVLSWLSFSYKKIINFTDCFRLTLILITKFEIIDQNLSDLIHGFVKSDDKVSMYKSLLLYLSKVTEEDYNSMASLSGAISRALSEPKFQDEFVKGYLSMLDRQFLDDKIFRGINNFIKQDYDRDPLNDAFSRSQMKSKIWLVEELLKIQSFYPNVLILAGWYGQLKSIYDKKLSYSKIRNVEVDRFACEVSDYIFNLSNLDQYKVKSINANINELILHKNGYEWEVENFKDHSKFVEKFMPDLIINTSAEHMTEEWFHQLRFKEVESNPIVVVQSNNLFDIDDHINCVYSVEHMRKKFPMKEVLYEGELQLKGYKRVMLIGRV